MAVKRKKISDGLFTATLVTVDANDTSEEAINTLRIMLDVATPQSRIASIEKFLDSLKNADKTVLLRAERIREILTDIKQRYSGLTLDEIGLTMLSNAEMWRREIEYMPAARQGMQYSEQQKTFRGAQQKLDEEKHNQWRLWQAEQMKNNAKFASQSKQEQARRLQEKYFIPDKVGTIAKRLEPLPRK